MSGHDPFGPSYAPAPATPTEDGPHGYSSGEGAATGGGVFGGNEDTIPDGSGGHIGWAEYLDRIGNPDS